MTMCLIMGVNTRMASYAKIEFPIKPNILCCVSPSILPFTDNFKLVNVVRPVGYYFVRDKYRGKTWDEPLKLLTNKLYTIQSTSESTIVLL